MTLLSFVIVDSDRLNLKLTCICMMYPLSSLIIRFVLSWFDTGKDGLLLRILPHYVLARLIPNSDSGALEEVGGVRLALFTRQLKSLMVQ